MKKTFRAAAVLLLCAVMLFLCACKDEVTQYRETLSQKVDEITAMDGNITTAVSGLQSAITNADEASYNKFLDTLSGYTDQLKTKYNEIANVEAPSEYKEQQELLKTYAADLTQMLDDSMELYQIAGESFSSDLTDEQVDRISELQEEITTLSASADAFDEVLNEILGTGDSESS